MVRVLCGDSVLSSESFPINVSTHRLDVQHASITLGDVWAIIRTIPDRPNAVLDATWLVIHVVFGVAVLIALEGQEKSWMIMACVFESGQDALAGDGDFVWMLTTMLCREQLRYRTLPNELIVHQIPWEAVSDFHGLSTVL